MTSVIRHNGEVSGKGAGPLFVCFLCGAIAAVTTYHGWTVMHETPKPIAVDDPGVLIGQATM